MKRYGHEKQRTREADTRSNGAPWCPGRHASRATQQRLVEAQASSDSDSAAEWQEATRARVRHVLAYAMLAYIAKAGLG